MIVIKYENKIKIISDNDLSYYLKKFDNVKPLGTISEDCPSIKNMFVTDRNIKGVISFFKKRIEGHKQKLNNYEKQLNTFLEDCDKWGVFK